MEKQCECRAKSQALSNRNPSEPATSSSSKTSGAYKQTKKQTEQTCYDNTIQNRDKISVLWSQVIENIEIYEYFKYILCIYLWL